MRERERKEGRKERRETERGKKVGRDREEEGMRYFTRWPYKFSGS